MLSIPIVGGVLARILFLVSIAALLSMFVRQQSGPSGAKAVFARQKDELPAR